MSHHLLYVGDKVAKRAVATEIAAREGLTIMFVRTKHGADRLAKQLRGAGVPAGALHGGKAQNNRTRTLAAFADGSVPVLVTTDVAARGIHVDGISLVVHVDPPPEPKAYLHRAGRTARAGEDGVVVTLVMDEERRDVEAMARKAGVEVDGVAVRPGDRTLIEITGARRPSGVPVAAAAPVAAPAAAPAKPARRKTGRRDTPAAAGGRGAAKQSRSRSAAGAGRGSESVAAPARRRGDAKPVANNTVGRGAGSGKGTPARTGGTAGGFSGRAAASASGDTAGRPRRRAVRAQQSPTRGNRAAN